MPESSTESNHLLPPCIALFSILVSQSVSTCCALPDPTWSADCLLPVYFAIIRVFCTTDRLEQPVRLVCPPASINTFLYRLTPSPLLYLSPLDSRFSYSFILFRIRLSTQSYNALQRSHTHIQTHASFSFAFKRLKLSLHSNNTIYSTSHFEKATVASLTLCT